jgi:hypothetical protein
MFGVGDFCLETMIIIKIESHPFYRFSLGRSKKWPTQKTEYFKTTNSQYFFTKISGIGPWGLASIDGKCINVAQPFQLLVFF